MMWDWLGLGPEAHNGGDIMMMLSQDVTVVVQLWHDTEFYLHLTFTSSKIAPILSPPITYYQHFSKQGVDTLTRCAHWGCWSCHILFKGLDMSVGSFRPELCQHCYRLNQNQLIKYTSWWVMLQYCVHCVHVGGGRGDGIMNHFVALKSKQKQTKMLRIWNYTN